MNTDEILATASEIAHSWDWTTEIERPEPNRLDVKLSSLDLLVPMVVMLRVKRLGYLAAITGFDPGVETGELEVLYHFCTGAAVVTLRARVPRDQPSVPSLCQLVPSAESFERELSEMFGVTVVGIPNAERLYLPEDWPEGVYPLRKDFDPKTMFQAI